MFDLDQFINDCRSALSEDRGGLAIRELVARAVSEPSGVLQAPGETTKAGVRRIHHSPDLTILNVVWGPMMTI